MNHRLSYVEMRIEKLKSKGSQNNKLIRKWERKKKLAKDLEE